MIDVTHLLIIGVGPLPFYDADRLYGFGIRAWQFAQPLLDAGHRITLVSCEFGVERESAINIKYRTDPSKWAPIELIPVPQPGPRNTNLILTRIEEILRTHQPEAIIAAGSTIATNLAAHLDTDLPIWMDMFGDLFAEVQAKTPFMNAEVEIDFFHQMLTRILLKGDRFSVVSEMQRGAAIGQLGLMGRLNQFTLGDEMVQTIPCALNGKISPVAKKPYLRGKSVGPNEFLVLCSGGFNTWTDVDTMFEGIERSMEHDRRVHCVVTGGGITGHHEDGYKHFRGLIGKSPYENRFHLLGWLSNDEVDQVTMECNLGINVDLPVYESLLGSRNRMLFWLQCGLPILTTITTEISQILVDNDLALGAPYGQSKMVADKIIEAVQDQQTLKRRAVRAKKFGYKFLTYDETVRPLLQWAKKPVKAGDNQERLVRGGQPFSQVDQLWHTWGFPESGKNNSLNLPRSPKAVIKTRPRGKNWIRRLLGS